MILRGLFQPKCFYDSMSNTLTRQTLEPPSLCHQKQPPGYTDLQMQPQGPSSQHLSQTFSIKSLCICSPLSLPTLPKVTG